MEENIKKKVKERDAVKDQLTVPNENIKDGTRMVDDSTGNEMVRIIETTKSSNITEETVTISKGDFDKTIQSTEDKVRGKMSKTIRELEEKIKALTPIEKTQEQIELENRIAALEASEKEVQNQKRKLDIQEQLSEKGLDKSLADYIKDDIDIDALADIIEKMFREYTKFNGFVPSSHDTADELTAEEFKKMKYSEKEKIMREKPELYKRLRAKTKR